MAAKSANTLTFIVPSEDSRPIVPGEGAPDDLLSKVGEVRDTAVVSALRGDGNERRLDATVGEDVVVLKIQDGPSLVLHPETARDLMLGQQDVARRSRSGAALSAQDESARTKEIRIVRRLEWRGHEHAGILPPDRNRGSASDVILSAIHVVRRPLIEFAADKIAERVIEKFDGQLVAGLHKLSATSLPEFSTNMRDDKLILRAPERPVLVLLHGTFSNTRGTFGKLWEKHPQLVFELFRHYSDQVYALDHPTLSASPIANALALVKALPPGARLHLLTHSRGGLVAEVLARVCSGVSLSDIDLKPFKAPEHAAELRDLKDLITLARGKGIRVDRVVRVACPARGTLLASKRLDAYLSVLKWGFELASIPVADAFFELLGAVAQHRMNPEEAPGLAEQMPDSPLVKWLHAVDDPIPGELRVVAGDMQGDSLGSWLKTLLADAFYWTDNDLVVQTRSMYGGAPRGRGASFYLDSSGKVTHFSYFTNDSTANLVVKALVDDEPPENFRPIGPLSWSGKSSEGVRAGRRQTRDPDPARPAVFLLPGVLGSHLKVNGERVWLSWRIMNGLEKLRLSGEPPGSVTPDAPIGMIYGDLIDLLSETHEVIEFPYDWRQPIETEAIRLGNEVQKALNARAQRGLPVRMVAHSMGGLLARTLQLECPTIWDRMLSNPDARILMLGTPNAGSFAPMQVLTGDDTFGNTLVTIGSPFAGRAARQMMAELPGFLQLQAGLLDSEQPLGSVKTWKELAAYDEDALVAYNWWHTCPEQIDAFKWGIPSEQVLKLASTLRARLDKQRNRIFELAKDKLVQVVGEAKLTPCDYEKGECGLTYLHVEQSRGDGRVTLESAMLPNVPTWQVPYAHGDLPKAKDCFALYRDLLLKGTTTLSPCLQVNAKRSARADDVAYVRLRPSRMRLVSAPPQSEGDTQVIPGVEDTRAGATAQTPLAVTVVNGNLKFVHEPVLMGHYRGATLAGSELGVDRLIGGTMSDSLRLGRYPQQLDGQQVFPNTGVNRASDAEKLRPAGVIVIGLGEEGQLRGSALIAAVRQGVIAWSQRLAEQVPAAPPTFDLASTLVGSGGINVSAGDSARIVVEGVYQANQRLAASNWPRVGKLRLVEWYLDRATDAWRSLQLLSAADPGRYSIDDVVQFTEGARRRPLDSSYRGADYDLISAISQEDRLGEASIAYTLDTRRARTEVRAVATQSSLLRELVSTASSDGNRDQQIGRTLFQLVIPLEMRPFLTGSTEMQIELDAGTAGIPWELLDSGSSDAGASDVQHPWAIRSKLLRKLRTADFRRQVNDAGTQAHVLVIGEPNCDQRNYPRLPDARAEAEAVADLFKKEFGEDRVCALYSTTESSPGPSARDVINSLLVRDWRIVHIAGHGEAPGQYGPLPEHDDGLRGVVLSNGTYLGPREIRNMERVPELVFINCCHLAKRSTDQLLVDPFNSRFNRPQFAATVAEELIKIGVRCVIAAGWAVDDKAAKAFATTFYRAVIAGQSFIEAVALARQAAWRLNTNTWAAYQCYGDADWCLDRTREHVTTRTISLDERYANVASPPALTLALEELVLKSRYEKPDPEKHRERICYLEQKFGERYHEIGAVAEGFGLAWAEAGDEAKAIDWYKTALEANDGSATLGAAHQYVNLSANLAWTTLREELKEIDRIRSMQKTRATDKKYEDLRDKAIGCAREKVKAAFGRMESLLTFPETAERLSICGSAYKRLAMIESRAKRRREEKAALDKMSSYYGRAMECAQKTNQSAFLYAAMNRLAAELSLSMRSRAGRVDSGLLPRIRDELREKNNHSADFWSVAGESELELYAILERRCLADHWQKLDADYQILHRRVPSVKYWRSIYDQCEFVLSNYVLRQTSGPEKTAGQRLLDRLWAWTGPEVRN
jgi:pimeloyl-ACP methyl ester carboxylesterase